MLAMLFDFCCDDYDYSTKKLPVKCSVFYLRVYILQSKSPHVIATQRFRANFRQKMRLDGNLRIANGIVDVGAYEFGNIYRSDASIGTPLTQAEFDTIREQYVDLNLSENILDYDVIVIDADQLSDSALRYAIEQARRNDLTELPEGTLIVLRTAVFQDETQQTFKDRREFKGSLFQQLNEVYEYLDLCNKLHASFDKLLRIDARDYPEVALREALLNAVVHREYSLSGSILVKIFSDRIEFISPGGLVRGIEVDDIMSGYSICRNQSLAAVFYRLQLIEAYGTGILKIFEAYADNPRKPKFEITPNVFKLILPNKNFAVRTDITEVAQTPETRILRFVDANGSITRKQTEDLLGVSQTSAGQVLRKLYESGVLAKTGNSRKTIYI